MANTRELVLKALYRIETDGAYANQELKQLLQHPQLPEKDRGFATELFWGVLRNQLFLDYVIGQFSSVKLKKLSPWIHGILRLGIYQITKMERIPDSAACNEMVKLAGKYSKGASRGFVNGVLRNVSRNKETLVLPKDVKEALSVQYSCPLWLTQKLYEQYGEETCEQILAASLKAYPVTLRVNTLKTSREELAHALKEEGISTTEVAGNPYALKVEGAISVDRSRAYQEGWYTLQNTSSMAAALALNPKAGERVLDLCAAPGGKTTFLAELMQNRGEVLACDIHPHKIALIQAAAKRLGLGCITAMEQDATQYQPEWENRFDRVLADVPCSGIGVIHKKPDIKWNRNASDIPALCEIQKQILKNAGRYVKQGGSLVYYTCTILKEENREQVDWFLNQHPDFMLKEEQTLFTHETGGSGFYIARLEKR